MFPFFEGKYLKKKSSLLSNWKKEKSEMHTISEKKKITVDDSLKGKHSVKLWFLKNCEKQLKTTF